VQDWSRIVNTTIHEYVRDEEINIVRNRKLLAMMQDRGRITMGHSGDIIDWKVRYKRAPMQGYADSDTLTFSRRDRWKTAQLDWRGYAATDSMTKLERLKNKDTQAIIKVYSQIAESLMSDMDDQFGDEFYIDGNASGNTKRIHGFESMFASTTASSSGLAPIGTNGATYAGLVTTLGNYGGLWTGTWPTGSGDAHYDFWTPLVVDYTSAITTANGGWSASSKTWSNTCKEAMRFGIIKGRKNKSKKGQLDLILLNDELFRQFGNMLDASERLTVEKGSNPGKNSLYSLGFGDAVNFEGVEVSYEYGIPSNLGYGFSMDNCELMSLQPQLFVPVGPDYDISTQSYRFSIDFFGNLRCNCRYFLKLQNLAGT
jgi:hypothetical protein